jgi:hypothetical protein
MLIFKNARHFYTGATKHLSGVRWISGTKFVSFFHDKFDSVGVAEKSSKNKNSKWYGIDPKEIVEIWEAEKNRASRDGDKFHAFKESQYLLKNTIKYLGHDLPVVPCMFYDNGDKISSDQRMTSGVYPEAILWKQIDERFGICGQSDVPVIAGNKIIIGDHKTSKEIKSSNKWEQMRYPFQDMDVCEVTKFTIQTNLYAWIIKQNNPDYEIDRLFIQHAKFEIESEDQYGFPTYRFDNGIPVVRDIETIYLPIIQDKIQEAVNIVQLNLSKFV